MSVANILNSLTCVMCIVDMDTPGCSWRRTEKERVCVHICGFHGYPMCVHEGGRGQLTFVGLVIDGARWWTSCVPFGPGLPLTPGSPIDMSGGRMGKTQLRS